MSKSNSIAAIGNHFSFGNIASFVAEVVLCSLEDNARYLEGISALALEDPF